jgi:hypothetical protein
MFFLKKNSVQKKNKKNNIIQFKKRTEKDFFKRIRKKLKIMLSTTNRFLPLVLFP